MNHMKQVADMLGVELGEKFKVSDHGDCLYSLTDCGVSGATASLLVNILCGKFTIIKQPWKPEKGKRYWVLCGKDCVLIETRWDDTFKDKMYYAIGNCYKTMEDALADKENLIERIKKIAEDNGRKISWTADELRRMKEI